MKILVSPTEPAEAIRGLGRRSVLPEKYGVDVLCIDGGKMAGAQRKQFPGDFLASLGDGRLSKELGQMAGLSFAVLVIEGQGRWRDDGTLISPQVFTREQLAGIALSVQEHGVRWLVAKDTADTARVIRETFNWWAKSAHRSLDRRPKPEGGVWGRASNKQWGVHLLQSFPGIGPEIATRIYDEYGVPLAWTVTEDELMGVEGVGKQRARALIKAIAVIAR